MIDYICDFNSPAFVPLVVFARVIGPGAPSQLIPCCSSSPVFPERERRRGWGVVSVVEVVTELTPFAWLTSCMELVAYPLSREMLYTLRYSFLLNSEGFAVCSKAVKQYLEAAYFASHPEIAFEVQNTIRVDCFPANACRKFSIVVAADKGI